MTCEHTCSCHLEIQEAATRANTAIESGSPFAIYRPKLFRDGDQWCALYGENIQEGVVGFGSSPLWAADAFNKAWGKDIKQEVAK